MSRSSRAAIFAGILALHAALLMLTPAMRLRLPGKDEEPLQLLQLAPAPAAATPAALGRNAAQRTRARARADPPAAPSAAITLPSAPGAEPAAPSPSSNIDWSAQAALAAQRQSAQSLQPQPRSLDDHSRHKDGAGLRETSKPQFGWYYAGTHRFDTSGGLPVIHLSDRCVIPIGAMIPLPLCAIGKIGARGDLFEHMRDAPDEKTQTAP